MLENSVEPKGPDAATPASPEVGGQPGSPSHVQLKSMSYAAGKQALAPAAQLKAAKKHVLSQEDVEDAVAWYKKHKSEYPSSVAKRIQKIDQDVGRTPIGYIELAAGQGHLSSLADERACEHGDGTNDRTDSRTSR